MVMVVGMASMAGGAYYGPVITETFDDAGDTPAGGNGYEWADIAFNNIPSNPVGVPGEWLPSGHTVSLNNGYYPNNIDDNWGPMVTPLQKCAALGGSGNNGLYWANANATGDGSVGDYAMDGIIRFTTPDHTPRPAVTGEKIVGSFLFWKNLTSSQFGFGFTDDIAALQTYQDNIPTWGGPKVSPLMMPNGYTDLQGLDGGNTVRVGFSDNVTGQIMIGGGTNGIWTHAVVDDSGDGFVDMGSLLPKTGTGPEAILFTICCSGKKRAAAESGMTSSRLPRAFRIRAGPCPWVRS